MSRFAEPSHLAKQKWSANRIEDDNDPSLRSGLQRRLEGQLGCSCCKPMFHHMRHSQNRSFIKVAAQNLQSDRQA
jgi:hypothetical protein